MLEVTRSLLWHIVTLLFPMVGLIDRMIGSEGLSRAGDPNPCIVQINTAVRESQPGEPDERRQWEAFASVLGAYREEQDRYWKALAEGEYLDAGSLWDPDSYHDPLEQSRMEHIAREFLQRLRDGGIFERLDQFREPGPMYFELAAGAMPWDIRSLPMFMSRARLIALFLIADMHESARAGDVGRAEAAFDRLWGLSRVYIHQSSDLFWLIGTHFRIGALERVLALSNTCNDIDLLRAWLRVSLQEDDERVLQLRLEVDRLATLAFIQSVYTDNGAGDGRFLPYTFRRIVQETPWIFEPDWATRIPTAPAADLLGFFAERKRTIVRRANEYFLGSKRVSELNRPARRAAHFSSEDFIEDLPPSEAILEFILPSTDRRLGQMDYYSVHRGAAQIALALRINRIERGEYPDSLSELVPQLLTELPIDPYASDGRYGYIKRTPTPEDLREFVLYSVGANGIDDGGVQGDEAQQFDALVSEHTEFDYIFNPNPLAEDDTDQ